MTARFDALGIVVSDMAATIAFYGLLGLDFDEDSEAAGHMEAKLPGGTRLMLDTEEVIASFDQNFEPPTGSGRIGLAFVCDRPSDVDRLHDEVVSAGHISSGGPIRRLLGPALRHRARSRRKRHRLVRSAHRGSAIGRDPVPVAIVFCGAVARAARREAARAGKIALTYVEATGHPGPTR